MSPTEPLSGCAKAPADTFDVALLDLDGVVYVGPFVVDHAADALREARGRGMRRAYVTNNAARTPDAVATHLVELGVPAVPDEVVTSAQAAARVVAGLVPAGSAVLVVGGTGLEVALAEHGLRTVRTVDEDPAAVVQGFSPDLGWALLAEGAYGLARGLPWVASNLDLTVPTPKGRAPGNGALVDVLRRTSGREPLVAGKPEAPLHAEALRRSGASSPLVVGDRLDTDIEGAVRAGTPSLLVLTGVTGAPELLAAAPHERPTLLGLDLRALLVPHPSAVTAPGGATCGGWDVTPDATVRTQGQDPLDGLRALALAVWAAHDAGEPVDDAAAALGERLLADAWSRHAAAVHDAG